jgi:hypothetical protein
MTNRDRAGLMYSSVSWGRWEISIGVFLLLGVRYLTPHEVNRGNRTVPYLE